MTSLQKRLSEFSDEEYAQFQVKLTPGITRESVLGVRIPQLRTFAKEFAKSDECDEFLHSLPHKYYDENMLHSVLLAGIKPYEKAIGLVEEFLPYVDNWATCDTLGPKIFAKHKAELLPKIKLWIKSPETYTCRFGIDMLMTHFLDDDFKIEYPEAVSKIRSDEYYINMMIAWYFATALAKQWDSIIPFIEKHALSDWTHRKAIQKAVESYRITPEQKEYLRTLK